MTNPNVITAFRKLFYTCKSLYYVHKITPGNHYSFTNKRILLVGLVPLVPHCFCEGTKKESNTPTKEEAKIYTENEEIEEEKSGWERLCAMYKEDEYGNYSKEITATIQATFFSSIFGLIYGGYKGSAVAYRDFIERNQATMFENHIDAKRRLQNHVTIHFGKAGFYWACKLSAFTGGFMLLMTSLAAYTGHNSILHYTLSGTVVGGLLRFKLGPPAMISGATVGCILGTFCGLTTTTLLSLTGSSLDEILAFQKEMEHRRTFAHGKPYELGYLKCTLESEHKEILQKHEEAAKKGI